MPSRPPSGAAPPHYRAAVARAALEVMSEAFNVPLARLTAVSRQRGNVAFARQMAMYLCHVVGRLSVRDVALEFRREPSTVSHACHAIEDRRDIAVFEKQLVVLEEALLERLEERVAPHPDKISPREPRPNGAPEKKSFDVRLRLAAS
ncbi:MAG: helix-turn-helix domain-containing protein [Pseudomonadota bacterium]